MVEYILVVAVTVIIILGLAQKMYKPLGEFVEGLMGSYVACLLETGELPLLGSSSGTSECRPPMMGGDPQPGQDDSGSQGDNKNKSTNDGTDPEDSDKVQSDSSSTASNSSGSGSGSGRNSSRSAPVLTNQASSGSDGNSGGRRIEIALDGGGAGGGFFNSSSGSSSMYQRKERYIAITGGVGEELKKSQKEKEAAKVTTQAVESGGAMTRKKLTVDPPKPRGVAGLEDEIKTLDIGQIIKYIMIAAIVIILVLLIGGQALQLSKSWEKGE